MATIKELKAKEEEIIKKVREKIIEEGKKKYEEYLEKLIKAKNLKW